ncbi:hypothetical protein [Selenomonas sp.]|uniref:hypothetical protein n=1 Tax=Selenomonas sp. TaxID=2053611 RepID=UPI0025CBBE57|nr:hypothetical protein [Selenomonas sp.]
MLLGTYEKSNSNFVGGMRRTALVKKGKKNRGYSAVTESLESLEITKEMVGTT